VNENEEFEMAGSAANHLSMLRAHPCPAVNAFTESNHHATDEEGEAA